MTVRLPPVVKILGGVLERCRERTSTNDSESGAPSVWQIVVEFSAFTHLHTFWPDWRFASLSPATARARAKYEWSVLHEVVLVGGERAAREREEARGGDEGSTGRTEREERVASVVVIKRTS